MFAAIDLVFDRNPVIGDTRCSSRQKAGPGDPSHGVDGTRDLHERAQRAAGDGYSCPNRRTVLGNDLARVSESEVLPCRSAPRDPARRMVGFHAYRRKWATERKHLPVKAEAGG